MSLLTALGDGARRWIAGRTPAEHMVRGFKVVVENSRPDIDPAQVIARLDEALALLEGAAPQRVRHLRRDLRLILVVRYPCRGAYLPAERICVTELTFLARTDISAAVVASSILHEGVHARVDRFRARFGTPLVARRAADMAREERLCRRAEIAFAQTLPTALGAPVIERALAALALDDTGVAPVVDWTAARARIAEVDGRAPPHA